LEKQNLKSQYAVAIFLQSRLPGHENMDLILHLFKNNRFRAAVLFLLYLIGSLVAYRAVLNMFFLSDDFAIVKAVKSAGPFGVWSGWHAALFRPVSSIFIFLDFHGSAVRLSRTQTEVVG
jgi:hypothetical protein